MERKGIGEYMVCCVGLGWGGEFNWKVGAVMMDLDVDLDLDEVMRVLQGMRMIGV